MWPDDLPADLRVPVGYTLYVPGDLDLDGTTLIVDGTVSLPPVPFSLLAASETAVGGVELATEAEVNAGTDAVRVVTPATLAAWTGAGGGVTFDEVVFQVGGTDGNSTRTVTLALALNGVAVAALVGLTAAVFSSPVASGLHYYVTLGVATGVAWYPDGAVGNLWIGMSDGGGVLAFNMINNRPSAQTAILAVMLPTGSVAVSDEIILGAFSP